MFLKIARDKKEQIVNLKEELKWLADMSRQYKKEIFAVTLVSVLSSIFSLTTSLCLKYVIDAVTGASKASVLYIAILAVTLMLCRIGFSAVSSRIRVRISVKIQNELQIKVYRTIFNAQWESLREYRKGDLINRLNSDVSEVSGGVINWWPNVLTVLTQFIYAFVLIVMNDPAMAFIALMSAPVSAFMSRFMIRRMHEHNLRVKELNADMMSYQEDSFHNLQYIKSFGISGIINRRLEDKQLSYKEEMMDYNKTYIIMNIILRLVGIAVTFISYAWGIYRLWEGVITYGTMVMFLQLTLTLSNSFNSLLKVIPSTINLGTSASRIISLESLPSEVTEPTEEEKSFIEKSYNSGVRIDCDRITFHYSDEPDVDIIEKTSFNTDIGETIAVVGGSGIGKTTFFRLLLGILECSDGKIYLENTGGDRIPVSASTRKLFAYVPQGNTIIEGTIAENLRLIKPNATDDEIISALKLSCAYDFVKDLPEGINSYVGESGKGFSEGQVQRISVARALIKDAPILLFDEVTSALDEETERRLLNNIRTYLRNKTVIFVTHKLNALEISDRIFKIENKKFIQINYDIRRRD